jgi:hypothetical protein
MMLLLPSDDDKFYCTSSRAINLECQEALLEDVLEQLTTTLIDADQYIFPLGYSNTLMNSEIPDQARIIWKAVKQLIVLEDLPKYVGFGRVARDEKGTKFGKRFKNLLTEVVTSLEKSEENVNTRTGSELSLRKLEKSLEIPVLQCSPEIVDEFLESLSNDHTSDSIPSHPIDD